MKEPFFLSVAIYSYTTIAQIKSLIKSMPNNSSVILMFHSILKITDKGYGVDKWYWEENDRRMERQTKQMEIYSL